MTASSIDLIPCRAPLIGIGVPQAATVTDGSGGGRGRAAPSTSNGVSHPSPAPACRNLFGATEPGSVNELLNQEFQQKRREWIKRYSFDIMAPENNNNSNNNNSALERGTQTSLIDQELQEHRLRQEQQQQQQQRQDQCNFSLSRVSTTTEVTPPPPSFAHTTKKRSQATGNRRMGMAELPAPVTTVSALSSIRSDENSLSTSTMIGVGSERLKPYARQTLITDCFSQRKPRPHQTRTVGTMTAASASVSVSVSVTSQRRLEVLQLPKSMPGVITATAAAECNCNIENENDPNGVCDPPPSTKTTKST